MEPEEYKIKATEFLIESLKLIVAISTLLFGGLLAYGSNVTVINGKTPYYLSLGALALSSILSVININSLINKIFRGEVEAIRDKTVKGLNLCSSISLLVGIIAGAFFLSHPQSSSLRSSVSANTIITESEIIVGNDTATTIEISKGKDGKIEKVLIQPQNK